MSADIIQFMPRPKHKRAPAGFSRSAFHSTARRDDLAVDHIDTSPCEYVEATPEETRIEDG